MLFIWANPGPSSRYFVMTESVRQYKIVKGSKLQKSESSLICVIMAERSTNALPVSTSILAHFCISVSLYNKNVLRCLINDILWLVIKFFNFVVIIVGAYACTIVVLKGTALRRMVMSLLETGRHPMIVFTMSL